MSTEALSGQAAISWERETENQIKRYMTGPEIDPPVFDVRVSANILSTEPPDASEFLADGGSSRKLQDAVPQPTLVVEADISVTYRSTGTENDVADWVYGAWSDEADVAQYVENLQRSNVVFSNLTTVSVQVAGQPSPPPDNSQKPDEETNDKSNIAVIAGASVGGAAFLLLAIFLYIRLTGDQGQEDGHQQSQVSPETSGVPKIAVSTEILVEPQDDVSTLGDPMFAPGGMLIGGLEKDEITASVGEDYDYARQYRRQMAGHPPSVSDRTPRSRLMSEEFTKSSSTGSGTMSKIGRMGDSLFADDSSFEQQFSEPEERYDVVAPAGKLGMVIDTPNGGMPVVHAIKDTSVLADRVEVGDRLLSVDGEDCTAMTAMQVSKLISLKSEKPARVLVFARSRTNPPDRKSVV